MLFANECKSDGAQSLEFIDILRGLVSTIIGCARELYCFQPKIYGLKEEKKIVCKIEKETQEIALSYARKQLKSDLVEWKAETHAP